MPRLSWDNLEGTACIQVCSWRNYLLPGYLLICIAVAKTIWMKFACVSALLPYSAPYPTANAPYTASYVLELELINIVRVY